MGRRRESRRTAVFPWWRANPTTTQGVWRSPSARSELVPLAEWTIPQNPDSTASALAQRAIGRSEPGILHTSPAALGNFEPPPDRRQVHSPVPVCAWHTKAQGEKTAGRSKD